MHRLFNLGVRHDKYWFNTMTHRLLSNTGAQGTMFNEL